MSLASSDEPGVYTGVCLYALLAPRLPTLVGLLEADLAGVTRPVVDRLLALVMRPKPRFTGVRALEAPREPNEPLEAADWVNNKESWLDK